MSIETRFESELREFLPKFKEPFGLVHIRTNPRKCRRLVYLPKKQSRSVPLDASSTHFFVLSYKNIDFFALEIIIYESPNSMTLFVSKADTNGHYYELEAGASLSVLDITTGLLRGLLHHYIKPSKLLRICLFAKSEGQYLFPLSSENPNKHVLPDGELVKWWLKVLNKLSGEFEQISRATLQIPGSDKSAIEAFFPKVTGNGGLPWTVGDIFRDESDLKRKRQRGAVYYIPRFPDDPKGRFLDYLVLEKRAQTTSLDQFILELQSRQEFRLGSVVGIIGVEGFIKENSDAYNLAVSSPHSVSYKEFVQLKDVLMNLSFATREFAESASEEFSDRVPEFAKLKIFGAKEAKIKDKKTATTSAPVNVLGGMLIRKKPKK
ncbi:H3 histone acetyltransferase RTT109 [Sugiyamaella lignohabitans]|uniref:histone acetyltransferase n=1 Tax=Sugiyamaella lignohabitans TaxID=796027 RepID=A0A167EUD1_9ASCO|nr:H3 histone acetyltransferase RTT109 [Sugiyamaella lignohabitans]ANB14466.1 H3 histone acetyltransferase RTT109 [Sugiyamaella lignohabitans]